MKQQSDNRARAWTAVVYPESAPSNWREYLDDQHLAWIESPLHDKDTDDNGELKKPHWHILLIFVSKKSYMQIKEALSALHTPNPQKCVNLRGMVRYFAHIDNPEKFQYSVKDIKAHGGADVSKYLTVSGTEKLRAISEMQEWIKENNCTELTQLANYALDQHFDDWYEVLTTKSTVFLNAYIRSMRHQERR